MAACTQCGFDNPGGMRFCGQCGARLAAPADAPRPGAEFAPGRFGAMMGADLRERLHRAGLEAAGQHRVVTVVFVDISGYTGLSGRLAAEDLYSLTQQVLQSLAQAVHQFDGVVDKFTGDGLMALFGAPIAHENNAELAVRAALAMLAEVARLDTDARARFGAELKVRIGLHSGPVVVGGIGSDLMMNFTAIGDTVNLARRLEQAAARGTILASESVFQQTQALVQFEAVPALALKGYPQLVPGYRVVGVKARPVSTRGLAGPGGPLVGRKAELDRLKQAVTDLAERRRGQMVFVTGEAGIGKSRLTAELKLALAGAEVQVVEGRSLTYRRTVPYWTWLEAFRDFLGLTAEASEVELQAGLTEQLADLLGPAAGEVRPYLEHWLSVPASDAEAGQRLGFLEPGQLRRNVFAALRDFWLAAARRRPIWLILEDLHWADDASLDLLDYLLDVVGQAPLLIYAISRPAADGPLQRLVGRARVVLGERCLSVDLHNLSLEQSQRLLSELLPMKDFPPAWQEAILSRADGVPYFLEEILRMLIDQEVVQRVDGHWSLMPGANPAALDVPETVQALVLTRFDRLAPGERRVLQTASVIGREFSLPVLDELLAPTPASEVRDLLEDLVERDFVLPAESSSQAFAFRHAIVSEAIYGTMLRRLQSDLHGQVGAALEKLFPDQIDKNVELLARHYAFSPRTERALHYLVLAGGKAARAYLNLQARQHFEQAVALLGQVKTAGALAFQAHAGLGDVLTFLGEYAAAHQAYRAALDSLPAGEPARYSAERGALLRKVGVVYLKQSDYEQALAAFAAARGALAQAAEPDPLALARVLNEIGWTHFERGEVFAAQDMLQRGLGLVADSPAPDLVGSLYNRLGAVAFRRGALSEAADYIRKSANLRETIGDLADLAGSLTNLGLIEISLGDLDAALEHFSRSLKIKRDLGDAWGTALVQGNLGYLHLTRGELDAAARVLAESTATAESLGQVYLQVHNQRLLGAVRVAAQDWPGAIQQLQACARRAIEIGAQDQLTEVYCLLAEALVGAGRLDLAREAAGQAHGVITGTHLSGPTEERGMWLRVQGIIALKAGQLQTARACLLESQEIYRALDNRVGEGRLQYLLGHLAAQAQDLAEARRLFAAAEAALGQIGAKLDAAAAARALASLGP